MAGYGVLPAGLSALFSTWVLAEPCDGSAFSGVFMGTLPVLASTPQMPSRSSLSWNARPKDQPKRRYRLMTSSSSVASSAPASMDAEISAAVLRPIMSKYSSTVIGSPWADVAMSMYCPSQSATHVSS